jgi:HD-GYP domain-containing protein (c-di-GMP phosphodiesterase class II)
MHERSALRAAIVEEARRSGSVTTFAGAFADAFADRAVEALCGGEWTTFSSWLGVVYRTHADARTRQLYDAALRAVESLESLSHAPLGAATAAVKAAIAETDSLQQPNDTSAIVDDVDLFVSTLLGDLDAIDSVSADQSRAVSAWCARIADVLKLSRAEIVAITRGALLHDVGKVAMPSEILCAARRLTDDEWSVVQDHTVKGERSIAAIPLLRPFAPIARSHHERFDGLGYPDGLDREHIPLYARIVAVADAFCAMIGQRPYRRPNSPQEALAELQRCKGAQFDPLIVDAMVQAVEAA